MNSFLANLPLLSLFLKASLLLGVGILLALALRRFSASLRHEVIAMTALSVLLVPVASLFVPNIPMVPQWSASFEVDTTLPADRADATRDNSMRQQESLLGGRSTSAERNVGEVAAVNPVIEAVSSLWSTVRATPLPGLLAVGWLMGALFMLVRMFRASFILRQMWDEAEEALGETWTDRLAEAGDRVYLERDVYVRLNRDLSSPITWGIFRPRILLPAVSDSWTEERLLSVLMHEMGHVKRHDALIDLIARLMRTVHWINPLSWVAVRQLRSLREKACDRLVIERGASAADYAQTLIDVARSMSGNNRHVVGSLSMARPTQLEGRILAILENSDEGEWNARFAKPAAAFVMVMALFFTAAVSERAPMSSADEWTEQKAPALIEGDTVRRSTLEQNESPSSIEAPALERNSDGISFDNISIQPNAAAEEKLKVAFAVAGIRIADVVVNEIAASISDVDWGQALSEMSSELLTAIKDGKTGDSEWTKAGNELDEAMNELAKDLESVVVTELVKVIANNQGTDKAKRALVALRELDTAASRAALEKLEL